MGGRYRSGCFVRSFRSGKAYYAAPTGTARQVTFNSPCAFGISYTPTFSWLILSIKMYTFWTEKSTFFVCLYYQLMNQIKKISTNFCLCAPPCLFEDTELRSVFVEYLWTKFSGTRGLFSMRRSLLHLYVISFSIVIVLVETIESLWVKLLLMQWIGHYASSSLFISFHISHSVLLTTVLGVFHHQIDS